MSGAFAGTGALVRLALRRDRIRLPVWIAVFAATAASAAAATMAVYPTDADLHAAAASINAVPSLRALYGPVREATLGATSVFKLTAFGAALVGLLMVFTAVRHTRAEEEAGRRELLGATVVGRYAGLAAGLAVTAGASVVLGLATAAALVATGLPVAGSLAFGLCWAAAGLVFGGAAAVTAQLTKSARSASGLAVLALVVAYFLRAVGDSAGPAWLSWASPIGWSEEVRPYAGDAWWVLVLPVVAAAALGGLAIALARVRDLDAGLLPDHPGPAGAGRALRSPWGLAWRLNRGTLAVWACAYVLLGVVCGSLAGNVGSMLTNSQAQAMITALGGEKGISDAFLAAELAMAGVITSTYVIAVLARLRAEERALRVEPLLAAAVDRRRLLGGYLVFAAVAPAVLLTALGLAAGLTNGAHLGRIGPEVARLAGAALAQLPAVWVLTGIATAVFGLFGRALTAAWVALVAFLLLGEFGTLLKLDQWVLDLSPFTHSPKLPGAAVHATPLLWLAALGAVLVAAGVAGFRRRDIAG
ncbi:ABC-2 type transport system permease protein [Amycolatopsis lexingtonensis]|uniref:ABC-2 type transport system permease protein n=1 Tax=Amycolatopsis lexingtonensis TaxID=218822 RepID=A0ABR9HXM6_9PSEU|nr:ABC transporter permease [Amycolatopsis lexingtonensis]MBE1495684.1 ABC-2 type transport system permease protein [Amycolatopsis lexingtonensis]